MSSKVSGRRASRSRATRSISRSSGCILGDDNAAMIRLRRGTVVEVLEERPGALEVSVAVEGEGTCPAIAYPDLVGPVGPGDRVLLNTTAVELGLGTGGLHFVVAVEGSAGPAFAPAGRVMKLRYTPHQVNVAVVEEADAEYGRADQAELGGAP